MTPIGSVDSPVGPADSLNPDKKTQFSKPGKTTTGIILGKFLPPHRGHEYLAHFASSFVDKLWIFVCSLPTDPIPGSLRVTWMSKLFPQARVIHIEEVNPAANRHQPGAQEIWARAVMQHMERHPDYVFASEDYGWKFAQSLQSRFIPVDPSRDQFPISGTELRSKPFRHWHYLPDEVRPHFVRQLMIEVPGFTQKAAEEIIRKAALLLNTLYVPVYSQFYRDFADSTQHLLGDQTRSMAQLALITSLKRQARCFLLRSSQEDTSMFPADCRPDLLIRLEFVGSNAPVPPVDYQQALHAVATDSFQIEMINLVCSPETAAHAIRDLAIDRYNDWF